MPKTADIGELIKHTPFFQDFDAEDIAMLARGCRQMRIARNAFVFRLGDPADGLYLVAAGAIKLALPASRGQGKVIEFFGPGQSFGEPFMFLARPYAADAQALEDSLLLWIDRQAIQAAIDLHPSLARQMLIGLSSRLHTLMRDIESVNLQSASQRLIGYLLALPRKMDRARFPCSKHLVASKIGVAPATLSRLLRQLIRDGLILVEGRDVVIRSPSALERQLLAG
ncbi:MULTISPECIES: Crp/Fnr family transcriptional regulator [Ralstonia solanacearum species complex]|uniref:Crp/Fnr family transcriptional regulator n=4 Tax=Ralstonia solanacearum TaxID=305 RepID=A0AAW5ZH34_RALSL|nr:Crp/Fnr family transcriptional regulator [Ralstonia solanacearum]ATJ88233.1 Crp/Fnr family transcriptional regulator [Ralstonia solanacearum]MBB6592791.1 Crp/Fnr family transcriptional regulator [Ralstonia solanacearum]MBB6597013.1 Crp/Fnr family transcriptional regulator [Ralstonia solanacearum]MDB0507782.1 Crp/Fnr family transcriptional regulator [Ralstonia solanacearum]MDB0512052.1 Crp/Fnr family transcriptional regulator [Ralstonia solanacearum]